MTHCVEFVNILDSNIIYNQTRDIFNNTNLGVITRDCAQNILNINNTYNNIISNNIATFIDNEYKPRDIPTLAQYLESVGYHLYGHTYPDNTQDMLTYIQHNTPLFINIFAHIDTLTFYLNQQLAMLLNAVTNDIHHTCQNNNCYLNKLMVTRVEFINNLNSIRYDLNHRFENMDHNTVNHTFTNIFNIYNQNIINNINIDDTIDNISLLFSSAEFITVNIIKL
jgi:hypothetical protein